MNKKLVAGFLSVALITVTGTGVYSYNQKVEAAQNLEYAEIAVDSLYNSDRSMLAEDIEKKIRKAELAVNQVEEGEVKEELLKEISEVKELADVQQEIYSILENGVLAEAISTKNIEELNQRLNKIKGYNDSVYIHLSGYLMEAESQLKSIDAAKEKVDEAEKTLDQEVYNTALTMVNKVKSEPQKDELSKRLSEVNKKIIESMKHEKTEEDNVDTIAQVSSIHSETKVSQKTNNTSTTSRTTTSSSTKSTTSSSTSTSKSNSGSTAKSTTKSTSGSSQTNSGTKNSVSESKPKTSGNSTKTSEEKDWDKIGEQLENHDWSHTGSGEIGEPGSGTGNTWDSWE